MLLGRKVSISKWIGETGLPEGKIQADAITADLRTQSNKLSFWNCGEDALEKHMLEDAVLAVASSMDRANKVDIVWLVLEELEHDGHILAYDDVSTPVKGLVGRHADVCGLDYEGLGSIASHIAAAAKDGKFKKFREKQVLGLLVAAAKQGRIDTNRLKETLSPNPPMDRDGRREDSGRG